MAKKSKAKSLPATTGVATNLNPLISDDVAEKLQWSSQPEATNNASVSPVPTVPATEPQYSETPQVSNLKIDNNLDVTWDTRSHDVFVVTVTKENGDMICEPFGITRALFRLSKNKGIWDSVRNCGPGKYILHMNGQKNGKWSDEWSKAEFTYKPKTVDFPNLPTMKANKTITPPSTTLVSKVKNITASKESFSWKAGDHEKYELKVVTVRNAPVGASTETTKSRYDIVDQLKSINAGAGSYFFQIRGFKNNNWSEWTSQPFDYTPAMNSSPAPTVPAPTVPAPTVPAPTVPAPTVPAPTVPAPTVPAPTVRKWWLRWLPPVLEPVIIVAVIAALLFAGYTAIKKMGWLDSKSTGNDNVAELLEKIIIQSNLLSRLAIAEKPVAISDNEKERVVERTPVAVGKASSDSSNHGLRISADRNGFVYQTITVIQGDTNIVQRVGHGELTTEGLRRRPEGMPDHPQSEIDLSKSIAAPLGGSTSILLSPEMYVVPGDGTLVHVPTAGWYTSLLYWSAAEDIYRWVNVGSRENPDWRNAWTSESQHVGEPSTLTRKGVSYWVKIRENSKINSVKIQMEFSPSEYRP